MVVVTVADGGRWMVRYYILTVATLSGAHSFALHSCYDLHTVVNHIIIGQVVLLNLTNQSQGLMQGYNNGGGMRTGLNNNYVILTLHAYLSDHLACGTFLPCANVYPPPPRSARPHCIRSEGRQIVRAMHC